MTRESQERRPHETAARKVKDTDTPEDNTPQDTDSPQDTGAASASELSHQELERLRARLARKYH